jgi:hypothetical protein
MSRAQLTSTVEQSSGGAVAPLVAGKNAIINGGMDIFQRTSFSAYNGYALDRWYINSGSVATVTQSNAQVTPNSQFMMLMTATGTQQIFAYQAIETKNAIYYAGKTVTLSAYAAGLSTTTNLNVTLSYSTSIDNSVTGSWTDITATSGNPNLTLSSTVTRFSATYAIPSNAKSLRIYFVNNAANITAGQGIYLGDVQLEVGSVPTPFSRAGGTLQGELAAAQRYYVRTVAGTAYGYLTGVGGGNSTTSAVMPTQLPVVMRVAPTSVDYANVQLAQFNGGSFSITSLFLNGQQNTQFAVIEADGATGLTTDRPTYLRGANNAAGYIGFSAEL